MVVTYSLSRLDDMLEGLCDSWGGPMSVAAYHPRVVGDKHADRKLAKAVKHVRKVHRRCALHIPTPPHR